jgi:hypothetical protein
MHKPQKVKNLPLKLLVLLHWAKNPSILRPQPWVVQIPSTILRTQMRTSYGRQVSCLKMLKEMGMVLDYQCLLDRSFMVRLLPPSSAGEKYWNLIEQDLMKQEELIHTDPELEDADVTSV